MSNTVYLITGPSGAGKTSLSGYLSGRGYQSVEADSTPGLCYYINKVGKPVPYTPGADAAWWSTHNYVWELDRLRRLLDTFPRTESPVFLCGNAGNINKAWGMFKGAYYLDISQDIMIKRLKSSTGDNNFGQRVEEQAQLLRWAEPFKKEMLELGAVSIDATQPIEQVAKDIFAHIQTQAKA